MLYTKHTSSEGIQLWMVTQMIIKYLKLINYWGIEITVISIFYFNVVQLFVKQFAQITILYYTHIIRSEGIRLWMVTQIINKYLKQIGFWEMEIISISTFYFNVDQIFVKQFA